MARFSEHDTKANYAAAERFREHCLLRDGSLLFGDAAIWTLGNLERLHKAFNESPDTGDRKFIDKFRDQVKLAGKDGIRLAAEVMCIYFLFPTRIGAAKKREVVNEV